MPIDHQQATEHGSEVDRASVTDGRALTEAQEWLQRHGVGELAAETSQPLPRPSERPGHGSRGSSSSGHPREPSPRSEDVDADVESVARTIALRKLTARACTRHELDQALQAKKVPQAAIDAVLDRLEEVGLVDDASLAVDWVTSRQQRRHLSRQLLRRELQAKGVERSDIDNALDHVDLDAELRSARELVERKRAAMNGLSRDVQYRRLAGMLSRRGFDTSITTRVLSDLPGG
ncbi:MAG TPA: regulatory protein RecX [Propionibacteriaceae bacterium]